VLCTFINLNYGYLKAIRPYSVSASDFTPIRTEMVALRRSYSEYVVNMRFQLFAITPEKNRESMAKELNTIFAGVAGDM
jgi:hypothetical protein